MILQDKVALVTGASVGIGQATALALARAGADVAINYLTHPESAEELAEQVRQLGRKALLCRVDVSDQPAVEAMVERTVGELWSTVWGSDLRRRYGTDYESYRRYNTENPEKSITELFISVETPEQPIHKEETS